MSEQRTGAGEQAWQLDAEGGPRAYERYLVPAFFAPCADQLLDVAAPVPGERVLDVACGTGVVARRAAARVGSGGAVAGADVNDGMLLVAHAAAAEVRPAIDWRKADAAALPFPDGAFDLVCCQQGLQFFGDQDLVLRELRRVLAPAGRLALAVWRTIEFNPAFVALAGALQRHAGDDAAAVMRSPFTAGDRDQLRALLLGAGFSDQRIVIGVIAARFGSVEEFLRQEAASSPLAGPVEALDGQRRDALLGDLRQALRPHADDGGIVFPMQTWLVTARR